MQDLGSANNSLTRQAQDAERSPSNRSSKLQATARASADLDSGKRLQQTQVRCDLAVSMLQQHVTCDKMSEHAQAVKHKDTTAYSCEQSVLPCRCCLRSSVKPILS